MHQKGEPQNRKFSNTARGTSETPFFRDIDSMQYSRELSKSIAQGYDTLWVHSKSNGYRGIRGIQSLFPRATVYSQSHSTHSFTQTNQSNKANKSANGAKIQGTKSNAVTTTGHTRANNTNKTNDITCKESHTTNDNKLHIPSRNQQGSTGSYSQPYS